MFLYDWKMLNRKGRFVTFLKEMFNITVSSTEEVENEVDEKQTTLGKEDISTLKEISINSYEFLLNFYIQTLCEIPLATQLKALTEDDIDEGKELELFKLPFRKFLKILERLHIFDVNDNYCTEKYIEQVMHQFVQTCCVDGEDATKIPEQLNRYQWYGMFIIISMCKYYGKYKHTMQAWQAFELLLEVMLRPKVAEPNNNDNNRHMNTLIIPGPNGLRDPNTFRKNRFYNKNVEKAFKNGMQDLKKRFKYY